MLGYGTGLYVNGNLVDKTNPKYYFSFGLFGVSSVYFAIYLCAINDITNEYIHYGIFYVNGFL